MKSFKEFLNEFELEGEHQKSNIHILEGSSWEDICELFESEMINTFGTMINVSDKGTHKTSDFGPLCITYYSVDNKNLDLLVSFDQKNTEPFEVEKQFLTLGYDLSKAHINTSLPLININGISTRIQIHEKF